MNFMIRSCLGMCAKHLWVDLSILQCSRIFYKPFWQVFRLRVRAYFWGEKLGDFRRTKKSIAYVSRSVNVKLDLGSRMYFVSSHNPKGLIVGHVC